MAIVTLDGIVEDGQIRQADDVALPERDEVDIIIPSGDREQPIRIPSPRLARPEDAGYFAEEIFEVPADAELRGY